MLTAFILKHEWLVFKVFYTEKTKYISHLKLMICFLASFVNVKHKPLMNINLSYSENWEEFSIVAVYKPILKTWSLLFK